MEPVRESLSCRSRRPVSGGAGIIEEVTVAVVVDGATAFRILSPFHRLATRRPARALRSVDDPCRQRDIVAPAAPKSAFIDPPDGSTREFGGIGDAELFLDAQAIRLNRFQADAEIIGDPPRGVSLAETTKDIEFAIT
jgi:hypothetical protein